MAYNRYISSTFALVLLGMLLSTASVVVSAKPRNPPELQEAVFDGALLTLRGASLSDGIVDPVVILGGTRVSNVSVDEAGSEIQAELPDILPGSYLLVVSTSGGVASLDLDSSDDFEQMIHKADQALYQAKNAGRNQVKVYSEFSTFS